MKYYNYITSFMRKEELKDIPNIVKIFDNPDTVENGFEVNRELRVYPANFKHIKTVYLGSEVFDHHLLIEWANKILTNHYHTLDIVEYKTRHWFEIKLRTDPGKPEDTRILTKIRWNDNFLNQRKHGKPEDTRILIKIPYDLTRVIDLSYELDKKYATENRVKENRTANIQFTVDTSKVKSDPVNSPTHYQMGLIETIDSIKNILGHEKFQAYCTGNVIKYLSRYREKNGLEDLRKAETYIGFIIKSYEECTITQ